jgi:hypothetical protein
VNSDGTAYKFIQEQGCGNGPFSTLLVVQTVDNQPLVSVQYDYTAPGGYSDSGTMSLQSTTQQGDGTYLQKWESRGTIGPVPFDNRMPGGNLIAHVTAFDTAGNGGSSSGSLAYQDCIIPK